MEFDQIIADKLDQLIAVTRASSIPQDVRLWDAEQVGDYLRVSARQVNERYAGRADFPRPICLPTAGGIKSVRRWKAGEIIEWAETWQQRKVRSAA